MSQEILAPRHDVDALNKSLETPKLDPVLLSIANDYLDGRDVSQIAEDYGVSEDRVAAVLDKDDVKKYIDNVYVTQGYLNRIRRMKLVNQVIEQKVQDALESGVWSKRDLLDWMKHLNDLEETAKPKKQSPQVAIQVNNYDKLMKDLFNGG
jgi:RecG-like helicase